MRVASKFFGVDVARNPDIAGKFIGVDTDWLGECLLLQNIKNSLD